MGQVFGTRLKQLREERGLTQLDLGERLGLARNTIAMYEAGEREPAFQIASRMAAILGTTVDNLLGRDAPDPSIDPEIAVIMRSLKGRTEEQRQSILAFIRYLDEQEAKQTRERGDRSPELPAQRDPGAGDPRGRGPKTGA